jgi:hypothetical protein
LVGVDDHSRYHDVVPVALCDSYYPRDVADGTAADKHQLRYEVQMR